MQKKNKLSFQAFFKVSIWGRGGSRVGVVGVLVR